MEQNTTEQLNGREIEDGRQDIYVSVSSGVEGESAKPWLFIAQELYELYGLKYEEMKTKEGLGKFLSTYGLHLLYEAGNTEIFNIPQLLTNYKKLHELAEYFIARCEGREVKEGHGPIRSLKAYTKFKETMDEIKSTLPNASENTASSDHIS